MNSVTSVPSILSDARYVVDLYAKKAAENAQAKVDFKVEQLSDKQHNDHLAKDPTWINGVHRYDSVSRHNYTYCNKAVKSVAHL